MKHADGLGCKGPDQMDVVSDNLKNRGRAGSYRANDPVNPPRPRDPFPSAHGTTADIALAIFTAKLFLSIGLSIGVCSPLAGASAAGALDVAVRKGSGSAMARASRRANQGVNIQAVAERAGVSAMTVSNVINGRRNVGEATRETVMAAVKELGYKPNIAAQALASAASVRLGLLVGATENAFLSSILVGTLAATTNLGAQLLLHRIHAIDPMEIRVAIEALIRSGASTILAAPPYCELISRTNIAAQIPVPIMAMSSGEALPNLPTVRIDDYAAARDMTRHLIALGHRRIGFVRGPESHIISHTRQGGYRAALDEAEIAWNERLVAHGDMNFDSGLAAATYLLDLEERPTAIFASNDDMAAAVVSLAHRRGLRIPDDLSVAGFDDTPIAVKIWPTLTTIRQPVALIAERAATLAIRAVRARVSSAVSSPFLVDYLPYKLIDRESTSHIAV